MASARFLKEPLSYEGPAPASNISFVANSFGTRVGNKIQVLRPRSAPRSLARGFTWQPFAEIDGILACPLNDRHWRVDLGPPLLSPKRRLPCYKRRGERIVARHLSLLLLRTHEWTTFHLPEPIATSMSTQAQELMVRYSRVISFLFTCCMLTDEPQCYL